MATDNICELVDLFESNQSPLKLLLTRSPISAWADLAPDLVLESQIPDPSKQTRQYSVIEVVRLARRVILSRNAGLFDSLTQLWLAFGETQASCSLVRTAIEQSIADWKFVIYDHSSSSFRFSLAHYEFIESMITASQGNGVFARAINDSRIRCEERHSGFPIVQHGNLKIASSYWVHFDDSSEDFLSERVKSLWDKVDESVKIATQKTDDKILPSLPEWLHQLDTVVPIKSFESATLSCAMHQFANIAGKPLPFGVGFTGNIVNKRLKAVADVSEKVRAAKNAGVFLFFACADASDNTPTPTDGVQLVLLQEGLGLDEVIHIVNRACAESGITEYRWRRLQPKSNNAGTNTTYSPNLPDALEEHRCPVGFIGRENTLKRLRDAFAKDSATREMVILQAPARSGKTTLLCQLAKERYPFPVWYSFRRGHANHRLLEQLQQSVETQINARFVAVRSIESTCSLGNSIHSNCRVDIIVDGLDEADTQEHTKIIEWLQGLNINGSTVVGSQPISALDTVDLQKIELRNESPSGESDARELIAKFAERFATKEHLESISSQLQQSKWVEGLVEKSGANLWVLTEFLSAIERDPDGAGWPNDPHQLPLSKDVQTYCQNLVAIALSGYEEQEKPDVEKLLATVSFLDHQPWSVFDVLKLAKIDSGANWGRWGLHGVLAKNSRRLLDFNGQECRFFSPLTREAVRRCYTGYNVGFAEVWIELIRSQNEPSRDALLDNLVGAITSLLEDIGESGRTRDAKNLAEALLFKSPWLYLRLRMLIEDKIHLDILHSELSSLRRFIPTDQSDSINRFIDWLISWAWAIEDSSELLDEWWLLAGDVTRSFLTPGLAAIPTNQYRLLAPILGPTISDQRYEPMDEVASTDKQYSWLQGQRWDDEVIVQVDHNHHEVLERPFEHEYTSVPRLDVDFLAIASDGTEIGWNRTETKLSIRNTPSCVVEIFLDQLLEALGLQLKQIKFVREVLPSMELEICFAEPETEKLSLVRFTRTGTTLTLSRLVLFGVN